MNIEEIKSLEKNNYHNLDLDRLVVYSMVYLDEKNIQLSFENIAVGAFKLFPTKFSLSGFHNYPDATRVEKALWRCKGKKRLWIGGKTPFGYSLNRRSYIIASEVQKDLLIDNEINKSKKENTRMRRGEKIIRDLEKSGAYKKYSNGDLDNISESDFCYLLQATLDSPKNILRENLMALGLFAKDLNRPDLELFLDKLEDKFKVFIK